MTDRKPNRVDSVLLRGAEQAMMRVADVVKAREEATRTTSAAIDNDVSSSIEAGSLADQPKKRQQQQKNPVIAR